MKKKIWVYKIQDCQNNTRFTASDEPSDIGCIGGYDINGIYQQFESEMYHLDEFAEKHGFIYDVKEIQIDTDELFKPNEQGEQ